MKQQIKFKQTEIGKLPEEWEIVDLKEALDFLKDGSHNPPKRTNEGIRFIAGATDIKYRKIDFTNCTYISKEDYKKVHKFYEVKAGDVLMTIVGTIGNVAVVSNKDIPFSLQRSIAILRTNDKMHNWFLFYLLNSNIFRRQMFSRVNPTAQPGIYLGELGKLSIPLPPIQEQKSIAKILSDLDAKIELNNQMNKILEAIGQALFNKWFVDIEGLPKDWKISKIGNELKTVLGGTPDRTREEYWNGEINWINSGKVNEFRIIEPSEKITEAGLNNSATKILPRETVVLAITGATLGQVSRIEIDTCANQSVIGIIESDKLSSEYLYFYIKNAIKDIISHQTGGAQQHINKNNIDNYNLLVPDKNVLNEFNKIMKPLFNQISINCFESQKLSKIRDSLLPKLMSGEIRIR